MDNDNGSYVIHNKLLFAGVTVAVFYYLWIVVFLLLTAFLIFGILRAVN